MYLMTKVQTLMRETSKDLDVFKKANLKGDSKNESSCFS